MEIIIRKATENDLTQIYDLIKEFAIFIKTPEKVAITLPQMIRDKDYFQLLSSFHPNSYYPQTSPAYGCSPETASA